MTNRVPFLLHFLPLLFFFTFSSTLQVSSLRENSTEISHQFSSNKTNFTLPLIDTSTSLSIVNETKSNFEYKMANEKLVSSPSEKEIVSSSPSRNSATRERQAASPSNRQSTSRSARLQLDESNRLSSLSNKESTERLQTMILGGKPGVDYPNYVRAPRTKFSCRKMEYGGMFADLETKCQSYHVCYNRRMDTFICPTGTLFNQAIMACDFWYNVNCERAPEFYDMNFSLYEPFQSRSTARPRSSFQPPARSSQPVPTVVALPTTPRSVFRAASSTTVTTSTSTTRRPSPVTRNLPPPPPTTPLSTTTSSTTTETPRTKKSTTPRLRSSTQRTRPPRRPMPPGIDVDDRDWVFAWLKSANGTRADKALLPELFGSSNIQPSVEKKMTPENYPLLSFAELDNNHKTDTAFSFGRDLQPKSPFDSSFGYSVNHKPSGGGFRSTTTSSALIQGRQSSDKLRLSSLHESSSHPNPWTFPLDPEGFH